MGALRDVAKAALPRGVVAAYRRGRRRIIGRFGMPITPATLPRIVARTSAGRAGIAFLDRRFPELQGRLRRRLAIRRYLGALSYEFGPPLRELPPEEEVVARPHTFRDVVVQETLGRTDRIFYGLDRRIEGVSARTTERLLELDRRVRALREEIAALQAGER